MGLPSSHKEWVLRVSLVVGNLISDKVVTYLEDFGHQDLQK